MGIALSVYCIKNSRATSAVMLCKNFPIYLFSVVPPCGATVTQNLTYLIQDVTTNPGVISCPYTICPIHKAVNRIRLDLKVSIYSNKSNRTKHPNL